MSDARSAAPVAKPSSRPSRGRRMVRRVVTGVIVLVCVLCVLGLAAGVAGLYVVQRTLPQTTGTVAASGLHTQVSVVRDQWGVPHIAANDAHDLAFAQGYVTAQDRLWQMEFNRRVAQGRLAETFGAGTNNSLLHADEFLRTLGLYQAAEKELPTLDPAVAEEYHAYADGVNAFLAAHRSSLPLEFTVLGITPQPWSVLDSLAYGRVVALSLDNTWYYKYTRALIEAKLGTTVAAAFFPAYPSDDPTLLTASGGPAALDGTGARPSTTALAAAPAASPGATEAALSPTLLQGASVVKAILGPSSDAIGSNNWVVDGTRTTTGKPLLANDPHLGISMPAIWYEIALQGGTVDAIGFSFPGEPGIVVGHNRFIAWGVTTTGVDNTDLFIEKTDPAGHPGQYEYNGAWLSMDTRTETIRVRGGASLQVSVSSTRHGPILNSVVSDLKRYAPVALQWTAIQPGYTLEGFLQLDSARTWGEFQSAVDHISISQNFVYADVDGNIGYRMSGVIPLRPLANGIRPVDGSTSANEWTGVVPKSKMPTLFNPPTHIILTANNQIVPTDYPIFVTNFWDQGYRARRIADLLSATPSLSVSDFQRIQTDVYSVAASRLVPTWVRAGQAAGGDAAQAASILQGWNDQMSQTSNAAALYEVTAGTLLRELLEPVLGKDLYASYTSNMDPSELYSVLLAQMATPSRPILASGATLRDEAVARALGDAMHTLRSTLGNDSSKWQWGALHTAHFQHPLATVTPLNYVFDVAPVARPGDTTTVNVGGDGGFSADPASYDQGTVSSMREIIDLGNLDASLWVTTVGQSGQPFSGHYADLLPLWDTGRYQQMRFTPQDVSRGQTDLLLLQP